MLSKGLDVRLASLGLRRSAGGFCVAGAGLRALQGVGCTPWRPSVDQPPTNHQLSAPVSSEVVNLWGYPVLSFLYVVTNASKQVNMKQDQQQKNMDIGEVLLFRAARCLPNKWIGFG